MEANGIEDRRDGCVEDTNHLFHWVLCKTGMPRILVATFLGFVQFCEDMIPKRITLGWLRVLAGLLVIVVPRTLTYLLLYPIFRLVFGNLYPAYASYKAVRTKNVKEYVKWMMYWIVFALFTCAETFTDLFFSFWFPFYYEIKTILVVWLLSPATKGSSILYRRFVHPALIRREAEIDEALARATEQGYTAVLHLGSKGVNYATTVLMQTAIKGGGGLVQQLKKSYSLSDLTGEKEDENRNTSHMHDETDMEVEPRRREHVGRRGYSPRRTQSSSNRVEMYFSEVDVDVRQPRPREPTTSLTNIRSSDDISSGYSSGEALQSNRSSQGDSLVRTSSVGAKTRAKPRFTTKKTPEDAGEDSDSNDPPSSKNISLPTPLSLVTPEQALEILLLLSQNSNVADYVKFDRGSLVAGNDGLVENTSQSGPGPEKRDSEIREPIGGLCSPLTAKVQIIESIVTKMVPERSTTIETMNVTDDASSIVAKNEIQDTRDNSKDNVKETLTTDQVPESTVSDKSNKDTDRTVTDELCQDKFDELKQLLSEAHKAMNNIVYTQEKLRLSDASIVDTLSPSGGDVAKLDQNSKKDPLGDHVSSKGVEEDTVKTKSVYQAIKMDSSVEKAIKMDSSIVQAIKMDSSVDQATKMDSSVDQAIKMDSSAEKAIKMDSSVDQATKMDSLVDQAIKMDSTVDQAIKMDSSVDQATKMDSLVEQAVKMDSDTENTSSLDVWTTPNVSRSNSDSANRAGKYHKMPAPKVPLARSEEDLTDETDSQNALRATLVIKTGTLKTFSSTGAPKDVFFAHVADKPKGKKSKKQRTKEGFSKLLTIPKNIFHGAFYRDHKTTPKADQPGPDVSVSRSRSNSLEPRETIIELSPKNLSVSSQEIDEKSDDTSNSSDTFVLASNNDEDAKNIATITNEQETEVSRIREISRSPKPGKRLESDIF
ncbi:uncharacterized protein LOC143143636 isoform X2 [Ptiloglossa arizonensis]|uniref:uncharacterized protein LOC143143636 isoform X2 n=1 Tax=Ptiloglossa arizonensis TaxID=3350558 RepID=UPI003F9FDD73